MSGPDLISLRAKAFIEHESNDAFLALTIPDMKELLEHWEVSVVAYPVLGTSATRKSDWRSVVALVALEKGFSTDTVVLPSTAVLSSVESRRSHSSAGESDGEDSHTLRARELSLREREITLHNELKLRELALREAELQQKFVLENQKQKDEAAFRQSKLEMLRNVPNLDATVLGSLFDETISPVSRAPDITRYLRLLPNFNEKDPETFFLLFEQLVLDYNWPEKDQLTLLRSVFTGKAQEAYASLVTNPDLNYALLKAAVLRAYELLPEAYRQRFRHGRREDRQSNVEFGRKLGLQFDRWCAASKVTDMKTMRELVILEQFKNTLSESVVTFLNERRANTVGEASMMADEYALTHKHVSIGFKSRDRSHRSDTLVKTDKIITGTDGKCDSTRLCFACQNKGHFRRECPIHKYNPGGGRPTPRFRDKTTTGNDKIKPVLLVGHVPDMFPFASVDVLPECSMKDENENDLKENSFITSGSVSVVGSSLLAPVKILRDTGANQSFILDSVLPFSFVTDTGNSVLIKGIGLNTINVPLHRITLHSDLVKGDVSIAVRRSLPVAGVSVILGNDLAGNWVWKGVPPPLRVTDSPSVTAEPDECEQLYPEVFTACAVTRAMRRAELTSCTGVSEPTISPGGSELSGESKIQPVRISHEITLDNTLNHDIKSEPRDVMFDVDVTLTGDIKIKDPEFPLSTISRDELITEQSVDPTLKELFERCVLNLSEDTITSGYFLQNGLLVRRWKFCDMLDDTEVTQIVIPVKYRDLVLQLSHNETAGHFGVKKTYYRILRRFFWPKLKRDVAAFCRNCNVCQLTGKPNQTVKPAPLYPIPVMGAPFQYLIIDCVGPLPTSKSGCSYLLTIMCQATRYPAAYPLRNITTKSVLKALIDFISIFGIPKIIQSDQGTNFTSRVFKEVLKQLRIRHQVASAFHPQSQGALERFHQTLKSMLRAYCTEMDRDWQEGLPWLLLSAREVAQESTGFSPNDLVFGHDVRSPLSLMGEDWRISEPPKSVLHYVNDFRLRLYKLCEFAKQNLARSQKRMKRLFDRGAESRVFHPGDRVLMLTSIKGSPFQARFTGPYVVERQVSLRDYLVSTPKRKKKCQLCHVNLLKSYHSAVDADGAVSPLLQPKSVSAAVVVGDSPEFPPWYVTARNAPEDVRMPDETVFRGRLNNTEFLATLETHLSHLSVSQRGDLITLINDNLSLFSDIPSRTTWAEHDIEVGDSKPISQRFYRVSPEKRKLIDAEVKYMLENNIAVPSSSSWASPCLLVGKPDHTYRFCTDYRKLNAITKSDSYPLPRMEDCIDQVGSANYVSKFDLLKGYWQVPLTARAREISAFITPGGLYSYQVMAFGLRNAPSTFQRLINTVLFGLDGCAAYLDDVVVYSDTWDQHVLRISALFKRLSEAGLTVNLAKCEFGRATVTYLGKVVGRGEVRPVDAKVTAIVQYPVPVTKKELMRFLGMAGYYRGFCPNFSSVVAPLTDLLRHKSLYIWSEACQSAFEMVKSLLSSVPVLVAPRADQLFKLQVDASAVGAGAVLLQEDAAGVDRPVSYFSKKFNKHQINYSTIEKEALALVWALQHFEVYVGAVSVPLQVFSDHNPLTFLTSLQCPNQRLMRWCLFLQAYSLDIRHIKGRDNVVADALSRAPV